MTTTVTDRRATRRRWLRPALILIAVAVPVIAMTAYRRAKASSGGETAGPVFAVAEGPLTISVTESGTIKPREQQIIKNEIEGRTTILYLIPEGTRVRKGDLLVELDASQLQDAMVDQEIRVQNAEAAFIQSRENLEVVKNQAQSDIDKAELVLRFAREDLTQYSEGEFPNALKENEARITLAREEGQRAEEKLKWSRVLYDEKYLAESELQADELAVKKASLDADLATNNLALLKDFTYRRKVAQLESDMKQAGMALERVKRKASADVVQAEADLQAKESEFDRQSDKLDKVRQQIAKARIFAPTDGLVVYATSARAGWHGDTQPLDEGQEVRERQELIYLPTASTFIAEVKVHESNLNRVTRGLPVRITVDALPGREFAGSVAVIAPLPDAVSMFMNPDLKLYATEVHIEGGGEFLRTGMSCQAEIVVERFPSAIYVPVQSIVRVKGQTTAFVQTRSGVEARPVTIGRDNNRMVRILDGLKAGENVLLAPPLELAASDGEGPARPQAGPPAGPEQASGGQPGAGPALKDGLGEGVPEVAAPPEAAQRGPQGRGREGRAKARREQE